MELIYPWISKQAKLDNPDAQLVLSMMYFLGIGVEVDKSESEKWFLISFKNGNKDARSALKYLFIDPERKEHMREYFLNFSSNFSSNL